MGSLPVHRCTPAPAFKHSGLDYGGPFKVRATKGRGARSLKGYVALFVCLSTRAIHLELVSDMTTEAFLAALRRFFSQRGYCSDLYSDCATTFVGANACLKEDLVAFRNQLEAGARSVAANNISWHFIPPGLQTSEVYGKQASKAVLNSRPISAISDDPTDFTALTPGHFLVGGPLIALPEPNILDIKVGRLTKWRQLQQMQQDFWKRWSAEYLHELQARHKWQITKANIKVGNLVLVRDERAPPTQWMLGRVLEVHAGDDAAVRVAT
ncbi:PREDICTED: uncharacterized protein LOC108377342, partial [Rhagoletis zephyria]|uniref:uncharacterized protein LOC108377342 n=1 Tax=Rhagoletis zephyria TaxID=28612 RepID=UPI000811356F